MLGVVPLALITVAGLVSVRDLVNGLRAKYGLAHSLAHDEAARIQLRDALSRDDLLAARSALDEQVRALPPAVRAQAEVALGQPSPLGRARYMAAVAGDDDDHENRTVARAEA